MGLLDGGLRKRLIDSVDIAPQKEASEFFSDDDFRFGETMFGDKFSTFSRPKVFINEKKFKRAGAGAGFRDKAILGESLHNLKFIEPERYERLRSAAFANPKYVENAQEAYRRDVLAGRVNPEDDPFEIWHDRSRFDQVIGGYLQAGDKDIPTMKEWTRDHPMFGDEFRAELRKLADDLEIK